MYLLLRYEFGNRMCGMPCGCIYAWMDSAIPVVIYEIDIVVVYWYIGVVMPKGRNDLV